MKVKGEGVTLIGKELALELGDGSFSPNLFQHLPGTANVTADILSRQFAPRSRSGKWSLPSWLRGTEQTVVPVRTRDYYRTLLEAKQ